MLSESRSCNIFLVLVDFMFTWLLYAVCFLNPHMKHLLRSCSRHSKTTSALLNRSYLVRVLLFLTMLERYTCFAFYIYKVSLANKDNSTICFLVLFPGNLSGWSVPWQEQRLCSGWTSGSVDSLKVLLCGCSVSSSCWGVF